MLELKIQLSEEEWDDDKQEFIEGEYCTIRLEHSLVSISKWESKWHKSFIATKNLTDEEILDYIKFMTLTQNVDPEVYNHLSIENQQQIKEYIDNPMSATRIPDTQKGSGNASRDVVTSELIYYWMMSLNIPMECQKWHLNRLITLIKIFDLKNQGSDKRRMSKSEIMSRNAAINARNRARFNSKG